MSNKLGLTEISELCKRYGLTKYAFYGAKGRFGKGGITTINKWGKAHVDESQLAYLDHMDEKIKGGYAIDQYIAEFGPYQSPNTPGDELTSEQPNQSTPEATEEPPTDSSAIVQFGDAEIIEGHRDELVEVLAAIASSLGSQRSPLWKHQQLQEAADKGWLLTTNTLAGIVGHTGDHLVRKPSFRWGGFTVSKSGERQGQELLWKIESPK